MSPIQRYQGRQSGFAELEQETAEPVLYMGKSVFILFCLSEIRANDPSSLEWLKRVPPHLGKKNYLVFKLPDCSVVTFAHGDVQAHVWKLNYLSPQKVIRFLSVILYNFWSHF